MTETLTVSINTLQDHEEDQQEMLLKSFKNNVQQKESDLDGLIWTQFVRRGKTEIGN